MKKMILFNLLWSVFAFAQTDVVKDVTSSKIKVYEPSSSTNSTSNNSYKWTVKTDLFSFVSGEFPIIGEYRFAKKLSTELSGGLTYGLYENFDLLGESFEGEGSNIESKAAMGTSFRAGIKYYPSSDYDAIEGWAFGIQVFSRTNVREYIPKDNQTIDISNENDTRIKNGVALTISKQVYTDSNISFEYLLGMGFASIKHDFLTDNYDESSKSNISIKNSTKVTVPNFQLGLRIGFGN